MDAKPLPIYPFSNFPIEIIIHICILTARLYPGEATHLSQLSTRIRAALLPILVNTVILRESREATAFTRMLKNHPEICNSVRNLWMTCYDANDCGIPIFNTCGQVQRLAIQHTFLRFHSDSSHPLNHFICEELAIFGPSFRHDWENIKDSTLFTSLKRLRLFDTLSIPTVSGAHIADLPNLTHMALPFHEHIDESNPFLHLESLLRSETLKYIVILLNYRMITPLSARTSVRAWATSAREWDERLYAVFDNTTIPHLLKWEGGARDGWDIWDRAIAERGCMDEIKRKSSNKCTLES